jgi:hypothetical protein
MTTIKCIIGECPSVLNTEEPVSPKAGYICRAHSEQEQKVFFQNCQFDPNIGEGANPVNYWRGRPFIYKGKKGRGFKTPGNTETQTKAAKFARKAKASVKGHEKEKEILDILGVK